MAYFPGEGHTTPPIHLPPAGGCSTTLEHTTKANQLYYQKAQMQELANSRQSINRLPCEVLAHIFVLCKHTKSRKKGRPDLFCLTKLPVINMSSLEEGCVGHEITLVSRHTLE
ncbi:unnamed protein product [Rhizoctonia solani]|uniref:Uncharacterized protein n=1 Tax=Rhizoctonia solani TaxID=456999 RepID=A0A8H3H3N4_9AGAM|nr:unnamed protein product [Rhizoctonia solani]